MKNLRSQIASAFLVISGVMIFPGHAGEVFSGVAGYSTATIPANRDVYVPVPFVSENPVLGSLTLVGNLDNEGNQRISIEGLSGLAENSLASSHTVRLLSGVNSGIRYEVVSNDSDSLLVAFAGDAPSPGVIASVERAWTLDTLFPPATQSVFHESNNRFATGRKSELLVLSPQAGAGLPSATKIYFIENGEWIESGGSFSEAGGVRLAADAALVIRHPAAVSATTWEFGGISYHGSVVTRFELAAGSTGSVAAGLLLPGGSLLSDLGLGDNEIRPSSDLSSANRKDLLHVFTQTNATSPSPIASYFRNGGAWRSTSIGTPVSDDAVIPGGSVLVIENLQSSDSGRIDWDQTGGSSAN